MRIIPAGRPLLLLTLTSFTAFLSSACEGEVAATRCNSEVDCALSEQCNDGICVEGRQTDPEPTPLPRPDAGVISDDGGPTIDSGPPGQNDAGQLDAGQLDGGPRDSGPIDRDAGEEDAGPLVDGGGITPDGWWNPAWASRHQLVFSLPAGRTSAGLTLPIVLPEFLSDEVRIVFEGRMLPHERKGDVAWVALPAIDGSGTLPIDIYSDGPEGVPSPHTSRAWPNSLGVWHFDDDTTDSSAAELHGSDDGLTVGTAIIGPGRAFVEDVTEGIKLPPNRDIVGGHRAITVMAWARVTATDDGLEHNVLSVSGQRGGDISTCILSINLNGGYRFRITGALDDSNLAEGRFTLDASPSLTAPPGEWALITGVGDLDAQTLSIYLNDTLIAEQDIEPISDSPVLRARTTRREPAAIAAIGAEDDGVSDIATMDVDELRIWPRAFTEDEIAIHVAAESGGGLVGSGDDNRGIMVINPGEGPAPQADIVTIGRGETRVIDVLANDPISPGEGIVESVLLLSAPGGVDAAVTNDGRVRIHADEDAQPAPALFEVFVSDGVRPSRSTSLTVDLSNDKPPGCHQKTLKRPPGQSVTLSIAELATAGSFIDASASEGDLVVTSETLEYTLPMTTAATDDILFTVEDGDTRCTGMITIDNNAFGAVSAPAIRLTADTDIPLYFEIPALDGTTGTVVDIVYRTNTSDIDPHRGGSVVVPSRGGTTWARYHYLDDEGRAGGSGLIELVSRNTAPGNFSSRLRINVRDTNDFAASVLNLVPLVDLRGTGAEGAPGVRFYAAGSETELSSRPEGRSTEGIARYRVRLPIVYGDSNFNYFWAYFGDNTQPPVVSTSVWPGDVIGAWGLSESYEDQTGRGNTAIGALPHSVDGVDFSALAPGDGVNLPTLDSVDFVFPLSVVIEFEPTVTWNASVGSMALVSRFNGDDTGNYGLLFGTTSDYRFLGAAIPENAFVAKVDDPGPASAFYESLPRPQVTAEPHIVVHSMSATGETELFFDGDRVGSTTENIGTPPRRLNFDGQWSIGPGTYDNANFVGREMPMQGKVRAVRIWDRAMTDGRAQMMAANVQGDLLDIAPEEQLP